MEDRPRFRPRFGRPAGATRAPLARRADDSRLYAVQPNHSTAKKIGVVAVVAVVGIMLLFATGFLGGGGGPHPTPMASAVAVSSGAESLALTEAPVIAGADTVFTREKNWTARVTLVATEVPREELTLRVLRNGAELRDMDIGKGRTMPVPDIGLKLGDNAITVAYVWNGEAGPESNTVTVTRDSAAPTVEVASPVDGSTTSNSQVTVAGRAEIGSTVRIKNATVGSAANADTDTDGSFSASMVLVNGENKITVTATDTAGNDTTVTRTVTRDPDASDLQLELSKKALQLANLPLPLEITATLTNGSGTRDDGAPVTFSLSPPGVPTSTYQTTIQSEQARWTAQVPAGASLGGGFATAKVTLPNGKIVTGTALFSVR
jgi:hypothetical protein